MLFPFSRSHVTRIFLCCAALVYCLPAHGQQTAPNAAAARAYDTVIVRDVVVASSRETQEFQEGDDELLQKLLLGDLMHQKVFTNVLDGRYNAPKIEAPSAGRTLELLPAIVQYRRGNRMQRRLIGYLGGAKVAVTVVLRDAVTKRPLATFLKRGESSSGKFAGTNEEVQTKALKEVAENIVREIEKDRKR